MDCASSYDFVVAWILQMAMAGHAWVAAGAVAWGALKPPDGLGFAPARSAGGGSGLGESLDAGRARLRYLVNRDVTTLNETQVVRAPSRPWPRI